MSARGSMAALTAWLGLSACGFELSSSPTDGPPADVLDAPSDVPVSRVRAGLIGFWTFDDANGSRFIADTAGTGTAVPLEVVTSPTLVAPTFAAGNLNAPMPGRLYSAENTHLARDCVTAGGVTLEVWVRPSAVQGSLDAPTFVAGLAANILSRDIAIVQAGDRWVGQVRTTTAIDGKPNLISTSVASTSAMTHLMLVADSTQRILYVDGVAQAVGVPGPLTGWDVTFPMALIDEYQHARLWTGTLALVALYDRGLAAAEVQRNFALGPDAGR